MDNCKSPDCKTIKGIVCDVTNCKYHSIDCKCTAKQINVGPGYASSSADTVCGTFKPKSDI